MKEKNETNFHKEKIWKVNKKEKIAWVLMSSYSYELSKLNEYLSWKQPKYLLENFFNKNL